MKTKIKNILELEGHDQNYLYLVKKVNNDIGFFIYGSNILFVERNSKNLKKEKISTELLDLNLNILIKSFDIESTFDDDNYNYIEFKGKIESLDFDAFLKLCDIYSNETNNLNFNDFFGSLVNLFRPKKNTHFDLVGFYGELQFIMTSFIDYPMIVNGWHVESNSKYDFVFDKVNIEVKTTCKLEPIFLIKHAQLFNESCNYLCCVHIYEDNSGKNLIDLVNEINDNVVLKYNFDFQLKIENELRKIPLDQQMLVKFSLHEIKIFKKDDIETLIDIPERLTDITYNLNTIGLLETKMEKIDISRIN